VKKRDIILILLGIFIFSILAYSAAAQQAGMIESLLKPFGNIEVVYAKYSTLIDLAIYLVIFLGLAQYTLGRKFKGAGSRAIITGVGLVFAVGLALFERQAGFNLIAFGPIAALIFTIILAIAVWLGLQNFEIPCIDDLGKAAIVYIIFYTTMQALVPNIID